MTPDELRDALARAGFQQTEFARLYGKGGSTVRGYLAGASVPPAVAILLRVLAAHPDLKGEAIALAGLTPGAIRPPTGGAAVKLRKQEESGDAPQDMRGEASAPLGADSSPNVTTAIRVETKGGELCVKAYTWRNRGGDVRFDVFKDGVIAYQNCDSAHVLGVLTRAIAEGLADFESV